MLKFSRNSENWSSILKVCRFRWAIKCVMSYIIIFPLYFKNNEGSTEASYGLSVRWLIMAGGKLSLKNISWLFGGSLQNALNGL